MDDDRPDTEGAERVLGRDDILGADDRASERVRVPEWGGVVLVRAMSGEERDAFESSMFTSKGSSRAQNLKNLTARFLAQVIVDEQGEAVFRPEDVARLGTKNARALNRVFKAAQRLNGMSPDDIEEMVGNS